jgi:hypothetical protein
MVLTGRYKAIEECETEKKDDIECICSESRYRKDAGYNAERLERRHTSARAGYPNMRPKSYNQNN